MNSKWLSITLAVVVAIVIGCSSESTTTATSSPHDHEHDHDHTAQAGTFEPPVDPSESGKAYVLSEKPADVQTVIDARKTVSDGDDVVLVGRIGGSHDPWIEGQSIFTLVDESLESCDQIPGDTCPTPWDYCCETPKLKDASALVKVVGDDGQPIRSDARQLLGVRELTTVVVQGQAKRDDAGNLTVLASKVFVER